MLKSSKAIQQADEEAVQDGAGEQLDPALPDWIGSRAVPVSFIQQGLFHPVSFVSIHL